MNYLKLENFIKCHGRDLYSFCCYLTQNRHEADDLYQDLFIRALEMQEMPLEDDRAKSLFLSTAIRLWKDKKRKYAWRRKITDEKYMPLAVQQASLQRDADIPEKQLLRQEKLQLVRECVNRLPEKMRLVVLLYYMEELGITEIANVLDIPAGTVKSRLHKAKKYLAKELSDFK